MEYREDTYFSGSMARVEGLFDPWPRVLITERLYV